MKPLRFAARVRLAFLAALAAVAAAATAVAYWSSSTEIILAATLAAGITVGLWLLGRVLNPATRTLRQVSLDDAATADELFSVLMGEDVEARRSFIQRNAKDVRFLDI